MKEKAAASTIKNKREVEWLAQEMNAALKTEPR